MKLLLIRHAESEGNVAKILQGQQEHELSQRGHQQALQLSQYLAQRHESPSHIYASPLQRTLQTARHCQQTAHIPIQTNKALLEIHNGVLQGLTWAEANTQYPELCHTLSTSLNWIPIPNAEAPIAIFSRAKVFIDGLLSQHHNEDHIWVFSHGGILQHLIAQLMGCDRVWSIAIPPTGLFEFELNLDLWTLQGNDRYATHISKILQFNTTPHLQSS